MPHNKIPRPVPRSRFFSTFSWWWWTWRKSIGIYAAGKTSVICKNNFLCNPLKRFEWFLAFHVEHWVLGTTMRGYKAMQATAWVGYSTGTKVNAQFIIECSFIQITNFGTKFNLKQLNVSILIWTDRKKPFPVVLQGIIATWQLALPLLWR